MEKSTPSAKAISRRSKLRLSMLSVATGYSFSLVLKWGDRFLLSGEGSWALRAGVVVLPWLILALYYLLYRRMGHTDELETLITYRALTFAFFGLFGAVVVLNQLQSAGVLPAFVWTRDRLILAMGVLLLTGAGWSKLRYL